LGLQVSRGGVDYLLNKLSHVRTGRGLLACHDSPEAQRQVAAARHATERFFNSIVDWQARQPKSTGRVRTPFIVADPLSEELLKLRSCLNAIGDKLESDEEKIEWASAATRCQGLAELVKQWLGQELSGQVYWIEPSPRSSNVKLASAPIEVGPAL